MRVPGIHIAMILVCRIVVLTQTLGPTALISSTMNMKSMFSRFQIFDVNTDPNRSFWVNLLESNSAVNVMRGTSQ
jgi:hypothetical protein